MTVGLFGGTFDPPHLGHLEIAVQAQVLHGLREVWWIPAYRPPHKDGADVTAYEHRMEMTKGAIAGHAGFTVSDIESQLPGPSYTITTIMALQEQYPAHDFVLLMGGDSLNHFGTWWEPEAIAERVRLLVYPRAGWPYSELPIFLKDRVEFMDTPPLAVQSMHIRSLLYQGESIKAYVSEPVRAYISSHGLYRA